jgi:hypothetical protein
MAPGVGASRGRFIRRRCQTQPMTPNPKTVTEHADLVEQLHGTGEVFSLTWRVGDTAEQRTWLIDHHAAVQAELRRRGHDVQATVVRDEQDTEHYAIRIGE